MAAILDRQVVDSIFAVAGPGDDFATQLYQVFMEQSAMVLRDLLEAISSKDAVKAKRLAHRLKGSAANVGASALSRQAGFIEKAATSDTANFEELQTATVELGSLFGQTRTELQSLLQLQ